MILKYSTLFSEKIILAVIAAANEIRGFLEKDAVCRIHILNLKHDKNMLSKCFRKQNRNNVLIAFMQWKNFAVILMS